MYHLLTKYFDKEMITSNIRIILKYTNTENIIIIKYVAYWLCFKPSAVGENLSTVSGIFGLLRSPSDSFGSATNQGDQIKQQSIRYETRNTQLSESVTQLILNFKCYLLVYFWTSRFVSDPTGALNQEEKYQLRN